MRSGFVNLIGRPNVGKSSILNHLIGVKLSIVTDRPQTTRKSMKFIYTDERSQIIFFDNPGFQDPKNKLGQEMQNIIYNNMKDADPDIYVMDNSWENGRLDNKVLDLAREDKNKKIVIINKCDLLKEDELEMLIQKYMDLDLFIDVYPVSAVTGYGFDELLDGIYDLLPEGPMYYDEEMITDTMTREIMEEILREKFLIFLDEEIPHGSNIETEEYIEDEDSISIRHIVYIERENHKAIVIGKNGNMINKIINAARKDMQEFTNKKVRLKIDIKVRKNWRKNSGIVKSWIK